MVNQGKMRMKTVNLSQLKSEIDAEFNLSTFTECSLDTANNCSLVNNDTVKIYNFDDIKDSLVKKLSNPKSMPPDSLDSLFLEKNDLVFFEFKNTILNNKLLNEIRMKIYESIVLIGHQYSLDIEDIKGTKIYLIHKTDIDRPETHRYTNGLCPNILFFLEDALGVEIIKYDAQTFEKYLNSYGEFPTRD